MAAPTPVESVDALIRVIEKSALLSPESLAKVREAAAGITDPKVFARTLIKDNTLTRWQADQLLHNYHRLVIGKYKLLDQLETSPTGRVYLAEHVQMGRRHALKVLAKRLATNPDAVARFLKGAQHACGLDHRNISHVYDVSQDRLGHYVVMEYVEGQNLEQLIEKNGPLKASLALDYIAQAAEGLVHAHSHGVVHGDLKPANLLRDTNGVIKILEIGQDGAGARPETDDADESVELASLAAVIFQAPEMRGDGEAADVACDVYSIGSVLTFLLSGKAAKNSATAINFLEASPQIAPEVISWCGQLMADSPSDRPATMEEVLAGARTLAEQMATSPEISKTTEPGKESANTKNEKQPSGSPASDAASKVSEQPISSNPDPVFVLPGQAPPAPLPPPAVISIKTRGRVGKKLSTSGTAPVDGIPSTEPAAMIVFGRPMTPLVLAGAIGGVAVFVLGIGVLVVSLIAFSRGKPIAKANPVKVQAVVAQPAGEIAAGVDGEANPAPQVADVNPEPPPDAPPVAVVSAPKAAAPAVAKAPAAPPAIEPMPEPDSSAPAAGSSPTKMPAEPPANAVAASPAPTATPPEDPKPPTPAPPPKAAAAPKKAPATTPKKVASDPFKGFAKAVTLPELPDAGDSAATALKPVGLGPCVVEGDTPPSIALIGGDSAIRATRQKFELQPQAMNPHGWEVKLTGMGEPSTIATLVAEDGELRFCWTEEAVKQAAIAKQLLNCALVLGKSKQVAALRTPLMVQPLSIDIDKPASAVKWSLRDLPIAKQIYLEVTRTDGFNRVKQEPKGAVNVSVPITIYTGPSDKSAPLIFKLNTSSTANAIDVKVQTTVKLEGAGDQPRPYRRKDLTAMQPLLAQELSQRKKEYDTTKAKRPTLQADKELQEAMVIRMANDLATVNIKMDQVRYIVDFSEATEGAAKVHFRAYHLAGNTKIDLLRTEEETAPAKK
jgi:serine/threonine protein kinase